MIHAIHACLTRHHTPVSRSYSLHLWPHRLHFPFTAPNVIMLAHEHVQMSYVGHTRIGKSIEHCTYTQMVLYAFCLLCLFSHQRCPIANQTRESYDYLQLQTIWVSCFCASRLIVQIHSTKRWATRFDSVSIGWRTTSQSQWLHANLQKQHPSRALSEEQVVFSTITES